MTDFNVRSGPACGGDTSRYADHYGGGKDRNDTIGTIGGKGAEGCGCGASGKTKIDDNGVAYTEKVVKSGNCGCGCAGNEEEEDIKKKHR